MVIERGEIWWTDLGEPKGCGPGYKRPVLIVQSNGFNRSKIATVVVAVGTSNLALWRVPGTVSLRKGRGGLPKDLVVNVSSLLTIDRSDLEERVGALDDRSMRSVDRELRVVLAL